jgi:hypothetical protein
MRAGIFPDLQITCALKPDLRDVQRAGKEVREPVDQAR